MTALWFYALVPVGLVGHININTHFFASILSLSLSFFSSASLSLRWVCVSALSKLLLVLHGNS